MSVKIDNATINNSAANSATSVRTAQNTAAEASGAAKTFQSVFKGARLEEFNGTMNELLDIVRNRGQEFLNSPQEGSLNDYKESVKYFLGRLKEEFLSLKDEFGAKRDGEQKVYQLVDTAGDQAEALSREAFTKDDALNLLSSLDEIRGLVLDVIG